MGRPCGDISTTFDDVLAAGKLQNLQALLLRLVAQKQTNPIGAVGSVSTLMKSSGVN